MRRARCGACAANRAGSRLSSTASTAIGARASGRIGVSIWAIGVSCAGAGALHASIPLATIGLVLLAAGNGLWGATMNIEAGLVQAAVRRTVVPIIQAMYAVGMLSAIVDDVENEVMGPLAG